jgi:hypothetical protein
LHIFFALRFIVFTGAKEKTFRMRQGTVFYRLDYGFYIIITQPNLLAVVHAISEGCNDKPVQVGMFAPVYQLVNFAYPWMLVCFTLTIKPLLSVIGGRPVRPRLRRRKSG